MEAGAFILISRDSEWDEALLVAHGEGTEWLCYSTAPDGSRFLWTLIRMTLGNFRVVEGRDGHRTAPPGIAHRQVNYMCQPDDLGVKWAPKAGQLVNLCAEGQVIMDIVRAGANPTARHVAGSAGDFVSWRLGALVTARYEHNLMHQALFESEMQICNSLHC